MSLRITNFINEMILYDYLLFGGVLTVFLLFLILAVIFRRKLTLALMLILLGFITLFFGSIFGYIKMHEYIFKNTTSIVSQKKLTFTKAVVVYGTIKNDSKRDFSSCDITASIYKTSKNKIKDYLFKFKPISKMSIIEKDILQGETKEIKFLIEPFTYLGDYNVSIKGDCK